MLNALKKLFGIKAQEKTQAVPYKVEAPKVEEIPNQSASKPAVKKATTRPAKIQGDKKPAVKAKAVRKPRAPKV